MPYRCKTCGSLQVYHHCVVRHPLTDASAKGSLPPPAPPPPRAPPPSAPAVIIAPPQPVNVPVEAAVEAAKPLCDNSCGCAAEKTLNGLRRRGDRTVRVKGDRLCIKCYEELKDVIQEHIPCPPGWPPGYYVARLHARTKVSPDVAITLLWCHGNLVKAAALKRKNRVTDVRVSSL